MPPARRIRAWASIVVRWAAACASSRSISLYADDGVERRPELVAHVGEELGVVGAGALALSRPLPGLSEPARPRPGPPAAGAGLAEGSAARGGGAAPPPCFAPGGAPRGPPAGARGENGKSWTRGPGGGGGGGGGAGPAPARSSVWRAGAPPPARRPQWPRPPGGGSSRPPSAASRSP